MSTIYVFEIDIPTIEVEATTFEEAKKLAEDRLEALSGSNDGSELLANGGVRFIETYECNHEETRDFNYRCGKRGKDGQYRKFDVTSVSCKRCNKHLSEQEVMVI